MGANGQSQTGETFAAVAPPDCGLALAIDAIGDRWTLMVLREALYGVRRFDQIQQDTGMPRSVLSKRLSMLVNLGVLDKLPYREQGKRLRHEYALTPRGQELMVAFVALMEWGEKNADGARRPRLRLYDTESGERVHVRFVTDGGTVVDSLDRVRARITREQAGR